MAPLAGSEQLEALAVSVDPVVRVVLVVLEAPAAGNPARPQVRPSGGSPTRAA